MAQSVTHENRQQVVTFLQQTLQTLLGQSDVSEPVTKLEGRIFQQFGHNQDEYLNRVEAKVRSLNKKVAQHGGPTPPPAPQLGGPPPAPHQQQQMQALQPMQVAPAGYAPVPQQQQQPPQQQWEAPTQSQAFAQATSQQELQRQHAAQQQSMQYVQAQRQQAQYAPQQQQQLQQRQQQMPAQPQYAVQLQRRQPVDLPYGQHQPPQSAAYQQKAPQQMAYSQAPQASAYRPQQLQQPQQVPYQQQQQQHARPQPQQLQPQQPQQPHYPPSQQQQQAQQPRPDASQQLGPPLVGDLTGSGEQLMGGEDEAMFSEMASFFFDGPAAQPASATPVLAQPMPPAQEQPAAAEEEFWRLQAQLREAYLQDLVIVQLVLRAYKAQGAAAPQGQCFEEWPGRLPQIALLSKLLTTAKLLTIKRGQPAPVQPDLGLLRQCHAHLDAHVPRLRPQLARWREKWRAQQQQPQQQQQQPQGVLAAAQPQQQAFQRQLQQPAFQQQPQALPRQHAQLGALPPAAGVQAPKQALGRPVSTIAEDHDVLGGLQVRMQEDAAAAATAAAPLLPATPAQALLDAIGRSRQKDLSAAAGQLRRALWHADAAPPPPPPAAWLASLQPAGRRALGGETGPRGADTGAGGDGAAAQLPAAPKPVISRCVNECFVEGEGTAAIQAMLQGTASTGCAAAPMAVEAEQPAVSEAVQRLLATVKDECLQAQSADLRLELLPAGAAADSLLVQVSAAGSADAAASDATLAEAPRGAKPLSPEQRIMVVRLSAAYPMVAAAAEFPPAGSDADPAQVEALREAFQKLMCDVSSSAWTLSSLARQWQAAVLSAADPEEGAQPMAIEA